MLSFILIVAACSNNEENNNDSDPGKNQNQNKGNEQNNEDEVVTITTAAKYDTNVIFREGESIEDNVHTRWMEDALGINVEHLWTVGHANDAFETKIRLDLAGNQPLPDVFSTDDGLLLNELMDSGKLLDISGEFENKATDRIKSIYDEYPEAFDAMTRDGKVYGLPLLGSMTGGTVMWVRQDWLDKFELEAPTTVAELEHVMEVFSDDPDGNGEDDTIPLSVSLRDGLASGMGAVDWLFGTYGDAMATKWGKDGDKLVYGSIQPSIKQGLVKLNEWMEKGYIDQEAAVLDGNQSADQFVAGKAGIWFGPYWVPNGRINPLEENVPGADYEPYGIPASEDGKKGYMAPGVVADWVLFSKDFEHMDKFFAYYDRLIDRGIYDTEVGDDFHYGFHEGYDYVVEDDGTVITDRNLVPDYAHPKYYFSFVGNDDIDVPQKYDAAIVKYFENPDAEVTNGAEEYVKAWDREQIAAGYYRIDAMEDGFGYPDYFQGAPTKSMVEYQERLKSSEIDAFIKIIYGDKSVDTFEDFVKNWKSSGGDDITEEVNAWYDSVK